ncbi:putative globular PEP-CTERM protein [Opitutaceae bacterium TAV4]|nr:putative globular PEP-CTERM protein [Opitutaceae bacterium TAV4]RRJ98206.1 putative globular PEP-CTERM protein [Opitutaceae bacterium TAV4]RRK01212.1 putative globular PEP-CTERM protein [Opitutaceae bacterium TAV3]RRK02841.1 putative globular PEP-CTERM protein [Opitutaceae bacterium TAV3]
MKTSIKAAIVALGVMISGQIASAIDVWFQFSNDTFYEGNGNLFTDEEGNPLSDYDNYVVGVWYQTYGTTDQWTLAGGAMFADKMNNDPTLAGYVEKAPAVRIGTEPPNGSKWLAAGYDIADTITFMVRAWNYGSEVSPDTITDNQQLIDSWNSLVTGSKYAEATMSYSGWEDLRPMNFGINFPGAVLDQVVGAVPEPSTYAALAGLAMLAYVIVRRRR